ncbi:unnamed protein product [Closterium sp. Naga37s-1]|nr:unnamed protein product [Closterium sp. Naga37s-1]
MSAGVQVQDSALPSERPPATQSAHPPLCSSLPFSAQFLIFLYHSLPSLPPTPASPLPHQHYDLNDRLLHKVPTRLNHYFNAFFSLPFPHIPSLHLPPPPPYQHYDLNGRLIHRVPTRLSATASGQGENSSLLQTLNVKQARTSGEEEGEEWVEIKLEEVNRITAANRLQVAWFPDHRAYALSHQTAEDLVRALAVGVVGAETADADEAAEVIGGVKLPSRRPALVSETCLFLSEPVSEAGSEPLSEASSEADRNWGNRRVRAFHVLDSKGMIDTLGVFVEEREGSGKGAGEDGPEARAAHAKELLEARPEPPNAPVPPSRLALLLGEWDGISTTHRSPIYGETVTHSTSNFFLTLFSDGSLGLEETRGDLCFRRRGAVANHSEASPEAVATSSEAAASEEQHGQEEQVGGGGRVMLDGGQQITLLPGGLALSAPCCVPRGRAFFFETILAEPEEGQGAGVGTERPGLDSAGVAVPGAEGWRRRRVARTYDPDGLVVSSSVFAERKMG